MSIIDTLRKLLNRPQPTAPEEGRLIYVYLPEALEPEERAARYGDPLDAELQLSGLGWVSGGGSLLSAELEDGSREILHIGIDVDALDLAGARELLRTHLPELGCPSGARLEYEEHGRFLQDEYDGLQWTLAQPQRNAATE